MAIPIPGKRVRGSESGTPINALLDLLGRRWALGIIWNLDGSRTFREIQEICGGVSPSILNTRLRDLRNAKIVDRTLEGYRLTPRGEALREIVLPLGRWSADWSRDVFDYVKPGAGHDATTDLPSVLDD
jgi:DNA-binding HxlR family transcriptional regulator